MTNTDKPERERSSTRGARHARLVAREFKAAREEIDGDMVSTLLGTEGHPEHGTVEGYHRYWCRGPRCREAQAEAFVKWDTEQRTTRRLELTKDVLAQDWPGDEEPSDEELAVVADAALARYLTTKRWRVGPVTKVLLEQWPNATEAQATSAAEDLVDALAITSRRGAKGAPRD